MKLALSNIMWGQESDEPYLRLAANLGFEGLELAPSLLSPGPLSITSSEARVLLKHYESFGLRVVSLHALLYNRSDLQLFGTEEEQTKTREFLVNLAQLANKLECPVMVLGSPKSRGRRNLSKTEADGIAIEFFQSLCKVVSHYSVYICIEPLASSESDYINNHKEALQLVKAVNYQCFQMILDAKSMALEQEDIFTAVNNSLPWLRHFHVNDPENRVPMSTGKVNHPAIGKSLRKAGYKGYVSLEVGRSEGTPEHNINCSYKVLKNYYLDNRG